jgi:16S rRNA A1518/A1519 N6-dimethyltransferase RsmA/KsgA/DIM1 with predicted DNA glycosylase/AP lyase activity
VFERVEDYVRYRPGHSREILDVLREDCGLMPESVVVDVGSGTGLLTKLFLDNGNLVYGVEPNAAMREASEQFLEAYRHFSSVTGTVEATMLPSVSADFVVVWQAFHWFDPNAARAE